MTLVNAETGEVVSELTPDEARDLTERIRDGLTLTWQLVVEAHDRRAWKALGYSSFRAWVQGELNISRGHAYRMLDHGRVMQALAEHVGVSPNGDIPEGVTRGVDPGEAVEQAAAAVDSLPAGATPEAKDAAVRDARGNLSKAMADRQRAEREKAAAQSHKSVAPTPAGKEGEGTASRPEPSEPGDAEQINDAFAKHADPALVYRANFTKGLGKAHDVVSFDIEKAVATAGESLDGHRQLVESIHAWCDDYLKAARTSHIRRVK